MGGQALGVDRVGMVLGHYRVLEKIGSGGMGEVYRARDEHLARDVAIKFLAAELNASPERRRLFRQEALSLSKLNHPNIATIFDFDTQDGTDFLVMEYIVGTTLSTRVGSTGLGEREVLRIASEIVEGVAAAHAAGVIHRDLKPDNVRITSEGHVKVLDFGLARLLEATATESTTAPLTSSGIGAGTLPFMAPEQLQGKVIDERTDIFAIGAILYFMATGRRPFEQTNPAELVNAILNLAPVPPSRSNVRLSARLEDIVLKCLEKEPASRYQSAKELLVDLRRLVTKPSEVTREPRRIGKKYWAIAAVTILLVAAANFAWLRYLRDRPGMPIRSVAVLPMANLSGDAGQDYFADGMTEALIANLSKVGALKVISRTSVMRYKSINKPLPEIARELDVDAVVEGSVVRAGNRVRVTAQLINAHTDQHMWAESYDRELTDVLALQSEVARAISREIGVKVTPVEANRLRATQAVDPAAHDAYLKGQQQIAQWTPAGCREAIRYYQQATELQPNYPAPYAGMAQAYFILAQPLGDLDPQTLFQKGKAAALKAIELDPNLPEAHSALGSIALFGEWDWATAGREYRRALELNSNSPLAHSGYAIYLTTLGRHDEAIQEIRVGLRLDPLNLSRKALAAEVYFDAGRYEESVRMAQDALKFDPDFPRAWQALAWNYEIAGDVRSQIAADAKAGVITPEAAGAFQRTLETKGRNAYYNERLAWTVRERPNSMQVAVIRTALGERELALQSLEEAYKEHRGGMVLLKVLPWYKPLHSEPRFQELVKRVGVPD